MAGLHFVSYVNLKILSTIVGILFHCNKRDYSFFVENIYIFFFGLQIFLL